MFKPICDEVFKTSAWSWWFFCSGCCSYKLHLFLCFFSIMMNLSQISKMNTEPGCACWHKSHTDSSLQPCDRDSAWRFDQRPGRFHSAYFYVRCAIIDVCIPIRVRKTVTVSQSCQRWLPCFPFCAAAWSVCAKQTGDNSNAPLK